VASRVARVMVVYLRRSGEQEQKTVYKVAVDRSKQPTCSPRLPPGAGEA
jgi:hypothetical protein